MELIKESNPFILPDKFKKSLLTHVLEMGTGGQTSIPDNLLSDSHVWRIANSNEIVGYIYVTKHPTFEVTKAYNLYLVIYEEQQNKGFGTFALENLLKELPKLGITRLGAQVNSNNKNGLSARKILLKNNFLIPLAEQFQFQDIIEKCSTPLYFYIVLD